MYKKHRKGKFLANEEKRELESFIKNRISGSSDVFKDFKFFDSDRVDKNLMKILNIDKNNKNIFLFTNIFWDVGMNELGSLFKDTIELALVSIDILKNKKGYHLYIKTHPGEVFDSSKK